MKQNYQLNRLLTLLIGIGGLVICGQTVGFSTLGIWLFLLAIILLPLVAGGVFLHRRFSSRGWAATFLWACLFSFCVGVGLFAAMLFDPRSQNRELLYLLQLAAITAAATLVFILAGTALWTFFFKRLGR